MMFYVYVVECTDKNGKISYYTGYTLNLTNRIKKHQNGTGAKYCKGRKIKLMYSESYETRSEAMRREKKIKKFTQEKKRSLWSSS